MTERELHREQHRGAERRDRHDVAPARHEGDGEREQPTAATWAISCSAPRS